MAPAAPISTGTGTIRRTTPQAFSLRPRTASRCMCAGMGLASLPRFHLYAYLVSPGLQRTFILSRVRWRQTPPSRDLSWRSIIAATAGPNTTVMPTTTRFPQRSEQRQC
jgi:hypothetical protein